MEAYVANKDHIKLDYLQNFYSFIWTERYSSFGDFELHMPLDTQLKGSLVPNNHIHMVGSNYVMKIEDVQVVKDSDTEELVITGRSLEATLEIRKIMMDINKPPETLDLIFAHVGAEFMGTSGGGTLFPPSKIVPGFSMDTTIPSGITQRPVWDYIFQGKSVYEAVQELAEDHEIGFRLSLTGDRNLRFSLFNGKDRTNNNNGNPAIFSFEMHNTESMSYLRTNRDEANVALMEFGPDAYMVPPTRVWLGSTEPTGIDRKEIVVDAKELARRFDNGSSPILVENLVANAQLLGRIELRARQESIILDTKIELGKPPHYGHDYYLGDIVLMYNDVDTKTKYRVTEYIRSFTADEESSYPTFQALIT